MPATSSAPGSQPQAVARKQEKQGTAPKTPPRTPIQKQTIQSVRGTVTPSAPAAPPASAQPVSRSRPGRSSVAARRRESQPPRVRLSSYEPPKRVEDKIKSELKKLATPKAIKASKKPIVVKPRLAAEVKVKPTRTLVAPRVARKAAERIAEPVRRQGAQKTTQDQGPGQKVKNRPGAARREPRREDPKIEGRKERVVAKRLEKAAKRSRPTGGTPTGPLTPGQQKFGKTLAKKTGLSPRVVGAWMLAEDSGAAAQGYEDRSYHNWLNIGPFAEDPRFNAPKTAAKATAAFIKGKDSAPLGGGGGNIPSTIPPAAGKSDAAQMRAIENSDWSATGYGAGGTLDGTYAQVGSRPTKPGKPIPPRVRAKAQEVLGKQATKQIVRQPATAQPPPKKTVTRFQAIKDEAKKISSAQLPYVYGGAHVAGKIPGPRKAGAYDCSSFVSRVLQAAGIKLPGALVSGDLATTPLLKDGPGAVTVYANDGHTFMRIGDKFYGTSASNPGGGAGLIEGGYDESYLSQYTVRHVPGLSAEMARRMGIRVPAGGASAPGISYSADGTTATVTSGVQRSAPGPSDKPILSDRAKQRRKAKAKKQLGRERSRNLRKLIAQGTPAELNPEDYTVKPSTASYAEYVKRAPVKVSL